MNSARTKVSDPVTEGGGGEEVKDEREGEESK